MTFITTQEQFNNLGVFIESCDIEMLQSLEKHLVSNAPMDSDTRDAYAHQIRHMLACAIPMVNPQDE